MGILSFTIQVHACEQLDRIEKSLKSLHIKANIMANDFTGLNAKMTELEAKADETNATLGALAQAVVDLKGVAGVDLQPEIDAIVVVAQRILDKQAAAEDLADDQVPVSAPPAEVPPVEVPPAEVPPVEPPAEETPV